MKLNKLNSFNIHLITMYSVIVQNNILLTKRLKANISDTYSINRFLNNFHNTNNTSLTFKHIL